MAERQDQDRAIEPGLAGPIHVRQAFSCTETGSGRHFPGRREPIALRSPCSAQALGDLPWSPARRMRRAPGGCGKNVLFFTLRKTPAQSSLLQAGGEASIANAWMSVFNRSSTAAYTSR